MSSYAIPEVVSPEPVAQDEVVLVANGDLRQSANEVCWAAQAGLEEKLIAAFLDEGIKVRRAHSYNPTLKHGFIFGQRMGMDIFEHIHPDAPLVVAEAVWQYSGHLWAGLVSHRGPILTVANWSGQWPGLVGMLNLNGCLRKAGVPFSTLWSKDFKDPLFKKGLRQWITDKVVVHDTSHVHEFVPARVGEAERALGSALAKQLQSRKAILGVFDEGCMGMMNAMIEDALMNPAGIYKERLSQSALFAAMREVTEEEAQKIRDWLDASGMRFDTGTSEATDLTDAQILDQCRMYIAALRIADNFGCDTIGIQYQQGLKDLVPASDLVEGLLNNVDRAPVKRAGGSALLYDGEALPHFNEVDECAGLDGLLTYRLWRQLGYDPETTLHDVRYGEQYGDNFVWVLQISGAAPPKHFVDGWKGSSSERQVPMYFRLGGGTLEGVGKPGEIGWRRVFLEGGKLKIDIGRGKVVSLPQEEVNRRWSITTSQWPQVNTILYGVDRDQLMARHKSNHIQLAYAPSAQTADLALAAKAAAFHALGVEVFICGKSA